MLESVLFLLSSLPTSFAIHSFLYFVVVHIQAKEKTTQVSTFHDLQGKEVRDKHNSINLS